MSQQAFSTSSGSMATRLRRRRSFFRSSAPKFAILAFGVLAAAWGFHTAVSNDTVESMPARRSLYEYGAGVCDSYFTDKGTYISILLHVWGIFYMFWGLAIVCDDYFVTSLETISETLQLSDDVAGATFMAAGSSAPELFTSLMGVFAVRNDIGIGTIVGSAVFNLCVIIGGTAMLSPEILKIDWKPITRDTLFYGMSIALMIYVLSDGLVTVLESSVLVLGYVSYVIVMYFNQSLMDGVSKACGEEASSKDEDEDKKEEEEEDEAAPVAEAIALPLSTLFHYSIPTAKESYLLTFFNSIVWIGVLSYFMVTWASKLGCIWNIHPAIMGVTVLAAGTSVPDAIGSLLVAREGKGDMAVSNAIGSNVFDILLGLGLPWLLSATIYGSSGLSVDAENLVPLSIILFGTLFAVYFVALAARFYLTRTVGMIFFSFYFIFVGYNLADAFDLLP